MSITDATLSQLCKGYRYPCSCGKTHETTLENVKIGAGVITQLESILENYGIQKPFVLFDDHTYAACGEQVFTQLSAYTPCNLGAKRIEAGEDSLGRVAAYWDESCDGIIGIGSGTINDLCKMLSKLTGRRHILVGSAPSMDGFVSTSSSLILEGVKKSVPAPMPCSLLLDTHVLKNAPAQMLAAGLGDMLAKCVSLVEWKIANLLLDEYYCEEIADLVRQSLHTCLSQAEGLKNREEKAVQSVAEGLTLSGLAMSLSGVTRPASGMEHYISHILDIRAVQQGKLPALHGTQVGLGTLTTLRCYEWLLEQNFDQERALNHLRSFSLKAWEEEMHKIFLGAADEIIRIEQNSGKVNMDNTLKRLPRIAAHWDEIKDLIRTQLPRVKEIEKCMHASGLPLTYAEINVSKEEARYAFFGAKEIRDKYVLGRLLWDTGLMEKAMEEIEF